MFNFFNKKKEDPIRKHLGGFQDNFTKDQKAAILGSLVVLSKSDGQVHPKEMQTIVQTGRLLGIDSDDPVFARVASGGKNEITRILNTLNRSQKEWYIVTLHSIVAADGKVEDIEIGYALGFAEDIGISEDEYVANYSKSRIVKEEFYVIIKFELMRKLRPLQAIGMWALTAFILFLLASLFSMSFSEWNWFSKLLFWGPTIILGVWTLNDYFISPIK